jgi:geranylgeranyl diphosphate synthase type 3
MDNTQHPTASLDDASNYPTPLSPPSEHAKGIGEELIYGNGIAWTEEKERILLGPYDYLYGHPGKDIRSQCIAAFNQWLKVPPERLDIITKVVGMLHTSSLLVDDVEDSSVLRRGIPVAHAIFGTPQTINSANYVYFRALSLLLSMNNPKLIEIFTEELLNLHRGQGMDLYWRDSLTCPSEADYLEMVGNKTGGLFRLAIKLMQAESQVDVYVSLSFFLELPYCNNSTIYRQRVNS